MKHRKQSGSKAPVAFRAQYLSGWFLDLLNLEDVEDMVEEVAVQMPSPGEFEGYDIPQQAKLLRATLVAELCDATSLEEAREILFRIAEALVADPTA